MSSSISPSFPRPPVRTDVVVNDPPPRDFKSRILAQISERSAAPISDGEIVKMYSTINVRWYDLLTPGDGKDSRRCFLAECVPDPLKIVVRQMYDGRRMRFGQTDVFDLSVMSLFQGNQEHPDSEIHEIFTAGRNMKFFYDFDIGVEHLPFLEKYGLTHRSFVDGICERTACCLDQLANSLGVSPVKSDGYLVFYGGDAEKHSYHVVFRKYYFSPVTTSDDKKPSAAPALKYVFRQMMDYFESCLPGLKDTNIVDAGPYARNKSLRFPFTQKYSGERKMNLLVKTGSCLDGTWGGSTDFFGCPKRETSKDQAIAFGRILARSLVSYDEAWDDMSQLDLSRLEEVTGRRRYKSVELSDEVGYFIVQCVEDRLGEGVVRARREGSRIRFERIAPYECVVCSRVHDSDNFFCYVTKDTQEVIYYCFRSEGKVKIGDYPNRTIYRSNGSELVLEDDEQVVPIPTIEYPPECDLPGSQIHHPVPQPVYSSPKIDLEDSCTIKDFICHYMREEPWVFNDNAAKDAFMSQFVYDLKRVFAFFESGPGLTVKITDDEKGSRLRSYGEDGLKLLRGYPDKMKIVVGKGELQIITFSQFFRERRYDYYGIATHNLYIPGYCTPLGPHTVNLSPRLASQFLGSYDPARISNTLRHLREVISGGNEEYYTFLLKVLAFPLRTGKHSQVVPVIYGKGGIGKSLFFAQFAQRIYGPSNALTEVPFGSAGALADHMYDGKYFVVMNECGMISKENLRIYDAMKSRVTEDRIVIKKLYHDPYETDNRLNYVILTNHRNSVPGGEGFSRRFAPIEAVGGSKDELMATKDEILAPGWGDHFMTFLLTNPQIDCSTLPAPTADHIPATPLREVQQVMSIGYHALFERAMLSSESPLLDRSNVHMIKNEAYVTCKELTEIIGSVIGKEISAHSSIKHILIGEDHTPIFVGNTRRNIGGIKMSVYKISPDHWDRLWFNDEVAHQITTLRGYITSLST